MNTYEVAVLFHPDLEIDLSKPTAKVEKIITDNGGKIKDTDNWGKKKLAYDIAKQDHAVYVFYTVELPAENVQKVESSLNIADEVIRYLIVKPDFKAMAKAEEIKKTKAKRAAEAGEEKLDEESTEE